MLDLPVEAPELVLYRGDDRVQEYVLRKSDGDPVETTGWDLVCQVRRANPSRLVNVQVSSPGAGRILLSFSAALFSELGYGGRFDVEGKQGDTTLTFLRGKLTVQDDVTRREP